MNKAEVAKLLTIASMVDNRTVAAETVEAWHMALEKLDFDIAKKAIARHWQESTDYLLPAHIVANSRRIAGENRREVRSAVSRGVVPSTWPLDQPLGETESKALEEHRAEHRGGLTTSDGRWIAPGEDYWGKTPKMADIAASTLRELP